MTTIPTFMKAIVAAIISGAAPAITAATTTGGVDGQHVVASVIAAAAGGIITYLVPNTPKDGTAVAGVPGLVVTVKTDVEAFAAAFVAGVPELVKSAALAGIVTTPAAPDPAGSTAAQVTADGRPYGTS